MPNLIKYKGCPRCEGNLFLERDSEGIYATCLQCGAYYFRRIADDMKPAKQASKQTVLIR
jgi:predicted  nucleic acid-binding Zn-ribbon protein